LIEDYGERLDIAGRSKLETLKVLAERMYSLIDSLLEFSRVGRVDLAIQQTDLNILLDDVLKSISILLEEKGVRLHVPVPLPTIRCDRVRIGEVFRNLITNAAKYNDKPEKWIEITWKSDPASPGVASEDSSSGGLTGPIVFSVRDNGIGINQKHFESIFRIFKRLHGRDKFGGGTGVGLTIVKKIVARHNGRIWVESKLGEGTTFTFVLGGEDVGNGRAAGDPGCRR
jgi:light-regulated signal transduction histidine kinase (bacteriophytochrome)